MSDFKCVLIEDSRIASITNEEVFGVQSSGSQSTYQQFQAVSASNSSVVFNVQVPSENILIDRHLLIQSTLTFTVNVGSATDATYQVPLGETAFNYGLTESLQAFPLNSLFTTTQCTINNVSTSTNTQDVLPMLMRMNDKRMLSRYNSMTPSLPDDAYGLYADGILTNNNTLAGINNNGYDLDFSPRGAFPVQVVVQHFIAGVLTDNSVISTAPTDTWKIIITGTFTEPFLALSPFINCEPDNQAGLVGVNNMSFVLNVDNTCKRLLSTANTQVIANALVPRYINPLGGVVLGSPTQAVGFANTRLLFNFLSLQPSQYAKISTKNIVPYLDYPRYLTTFTNANPILAGQEQVITSQNIQLNQVPDLIIICARIPMSAQNIANTSSFLQINGISVNFNNSSGLLASATRNDLYNISYRNGSAQSFYEFGGDALANLNPPAVGGGAGQFLPTTGSLLVLNPCYDFSLPDYLSSSSLGQYQLQFNLRVRNQFGYSIVPELCIITVNSGIFATQQGTSQIFTGILTKQMVLTTKEQNPIPHLESDEYKRLVGGKMINRGMSGLYNFVKHRRKIGNKGEADPVSGGHSSGGHSSGGHSSGGASSGGAMRRLAKHLA
jgi:uncharacterized membrane protein YgcG